MLVFTLCTEDCLCLSSLTLHEWVADILISITAADTSASLPWISFILWGLCHIQRKQQRDLDINTYILMLKSVQYPLYFIKKHCVILYKRRTFGLPKSCLQESLWYCNHILVSQFCGIFCTTLLFMVILAGALSERACNLMAISWFNEG